MVSRTVKKYKAELVEKDRSIHNLVSERDALQQEATKKEAELQILRDQNQRNRNIIRDHIDSMNGEVGWMRNLIEALTIDPKVVYAKTDRDIRRMKQERIDRIQLEDYRRKNYSRDTVAMEPASFEPCRHGNNKYSCAMCIGQDFS